LRIIDLITGERIEVTGPVEANDMEITGLTADSRAVRPGFLFAALPGTQTDGRRYIADAIASGARAILAPEGTECPDEMVALLTSPDPRRALARMAAAFYARQPETMVAVTGTNGKTSVASFTQQIWEKLGHSAASLGTLGLKLPDGTTRPSLTTPDPVALHADLAELARQGVTHSAMEASSHGLDQRRLDGVRLRAAGFTNLSRDHLDYHGTLEAYLDAKARLFCELLPDDGIAVLNADAPEFARLSEAARGNVVGYGRAAAELRVADAAPAADGISLHLVAFGSSHRLTLPLIGAFQAWNVLCAAGLAIASGSDADQVVRTLPSLSGVPGRMERAGRLSSGAAVYIDYAHTPDALENVLRAARPHADGRLVALIGCGGDRDRGKRPMMGDIATRLADTVIVTDDNPRSETPADIRAEIMAAAPGATEIGDRAEAIRHGIGLLGGGDILIVAGKGHETGQTVGDRTLPFDDLLVARGVIDEMGGEPA
jgi:UDP-N-acetylmuramoyl-L-alanyl-D-glutamate--2,6-diaminopimelate ligase